MRGMHFLSFILGGLVTLFALKFIESPNKDTNNFASKHERLPTESQLNKEIKANSSNQDKLRIAILENEIASLKSTLQNKRAGLDNAVSKPLSSNASLAKDNQQPDIADSNQLDSPDDLFKIIDNKLQVESRNETWAYSVETEFSDFITMHQYAQYLTIVTNKCYSTVCEFQIETAPDFKHWGVFKAMLEEQSWMSKFKTSTSYISGAKKTIKVSM